VGLRGPFANKISIKRPRPRRHAPKPHAESAVVAPGPANSALMRQRRHRERAKNGQIVLQIELPEAEIVELLITAALLNPHADFYTREDLADGVARFLELSRHA
jgi:hypothetical protein